MLGHVATSVVLVPGVDVAELQGMDGPDEGHEEGAENEHDGLFLNHTEIVLVVVLELKGLNQDGHEGSGEEHTQGVFEGKREILMSLVIMLLEMGEVMQHITHHELVEEDDAK